MREKATVSIFELEIMFQMFEREEFVSRKFRINCVLS